MEGGWDSEYEICVSCSFRSSRRGLDSKQYAMRAAYGVQRVASGLPVHLMMPAASGCGHRASWS